MPTPIEPWRPSPRRLDGGRRWVLASALSLSLGGCGEPTARELKNRQEFEALLTAISLKNKNELEKDATRIEKRHQVGELSDEGYTDLKAIIDQARGGDWTSAEKRAYEFREQRPYFR